MYHDDPVAGAIAADPNNSTQVEPVRSDMAAKRAAMKERMGESERRRHMALNPQYAGKPTLEDHKLAQQKRKANRRAARNHRYYENTVKPRAAASNTASGKTTSRADLSAMSDGEKQAHKAEQARIRMQRKRERDKLSAADLEQLEIDKMREVLKLVMKT